MAPARMPLDPLIDQLRGRRGLLILDNCEHLVAWVAGLVQPLLAGCPELHVLATSREVLGVPGETQWPVPALSLPGPEVEDPRELLGSEAVRLFEDRAVKVRPSFALTTETAPAVAEVCRHLDGLPLAIELAAARVKVLPVTHIATALGDRFRLLVAGGRAAPPRQQTLRAAVDWSYELLSEDERAVLEQLSVFPGGCSLEAAEWVGEQLGLDSFQLLDLLGGLADKSLLVATVGIDGQPRYRMLALALASGDGWQTALSTALLAFALDAAARPERVPRLLEEARTRYDATADPRADWGVAGCQLQAAMGAVRAGDVEAVENANRELLTRAGRLRDPVFATWSRLLAGWVAERQGRPNSAVDQYRAALDLTRPLGASPYVAFVLALLGRLAMRAGELDRARSLQGEAVAMVDPTRSPWFASFTHHSLAVTLRRAGELDAAAALYRQAVAESLAVEASFSWEVLFIALVGSPAARSLIALGALARSRGDLDEAERLLLEGLELAGQEADAEAIALALEGLAAAGDAARAATLLGAAESVRAAARAQRDRFEAEDAEQAKAAAGSALGPHTLDHLIARGRGLALEQVIAAARRA
jgi:tetratricopeptide (TPR) repeat protein